MVVVKVVGDDDDYDDNLNSVSSTFKKPLLKSLEPGA